MSVNTVQWHRTCGELTSRAHTCRFTATQQDHTVFAGQWVEDNAQSGIRQVEVVDHVIAHRPASMSNEITSEKAISRTSETRYSLLIEQNEDMR
jgi:hypothetical protein